MRPYEMQRRRRAPLIRWPPQDPLQWSEKDRFHPPISTIGAVYVFESNAPVSRTGACPPSLPAQPRSIRAVYGRAAACLA